MLEGVEQLKQRGRLDGIHQHQEFRTLQNEAGHGSVPCYSFAPPKEIPSVINGSLTSVSAPILKPISALRPTSAPTPTLMPATFAPISPLTEARLTPAAAPR